MGTTWQVKIISDQLSDPNRQNEVERGIHQELDNINSKMSTYLPSSEISQISSSLSVDPTPVSKDTFAVLKAARDLSEQSKGAFDVTVGPLVQAWGFGGSELETPPSREDLALLLARVGHDLYTLDEDKKTFTKHHKELELDLSAIAKGYAVDKVAEYLNKNQFNDYLIEVGGELRASITEQSIRPWRVGIERPDAARNTIQEVIELPIKEGVAMATSGDYRNYWEHNGQRISHTIDGRTGEPIKHKLASVTVISDSALKADGWATTLNVLGPKDGLALAKREQLAAFFLIRDGDSFISKSTGLFDDFCVTCNEN